MNRVLATKTVYETDADGYYIGPATVDESPMEPGVFLMIPGAVELPPPHVAPAAQEWRIVEGEWALVPARRQAAPLSPLLRDAAVEKLRAFLASNPDVAELLNSDG